LHDADADLMLWWQQLHSFWASVLLKSAHVHPAVSLDCDADCSVTLCVFLGVQECMDVTRPFAAGNINQTDSTALAGAWTPFCTNNLSRTATSCEFVKAQILASTDANVGKRAGMVCQLLQDCAAIPSDCMLQPADTSKAPAALDLCTVGGTAADAQVAGVQSTAGFTPAAGRCLDASHCTYLPGQVCNKQVTTDMPTCSAGVDSFVPVGTCERTPCQTCKVICTSCIHQLLAFSAWSPLRVLCRYQYRTHFSDLTWSK
jgi:hypothetical protein